MTEVLNHLENTSIDTVTILLLQTGIRIFLLISPLLDKIDRDCTRGKREAINKYWHEKFCDLKPEIDKIEGNITAIKVLDENTKVRMEWQPFLGLFFGRHLFLIINWS
ncbi:hypothetical protein [Spiroplasma endosymbiont of Apeira syringaria]|uniref:hypothetical protein n=1 Tax=Spiroplasma endosymbiont of Apeira syringaria TaxID=3066307 RepID=UPI0030D59AE1